jgi:FKBP-type peptidyl-prolyl cis-trans isomerase (trigger factor)
MDLDTYFKLMNTDRETFVTNEVRPTAIERIERNLVIQELGRAESITIQDGDMNEVTQEAISELQYIPGIESMRKISNDLRQQITMNAMSRVLQRRILQRIKAIATDELEKAEEPAAETPEEETK